MTDGGPNTDWAAVARGGVDALRGGNARVARAAFERVEAAGRGTHQLRLLLAQTCAMQRDAAAAHRALDRVLAEEPANLYALILRGDVHTDAGDLRAAASWYRAALAQAPRAGVLPPDLQQALRRVETAIERAGAVFEAQLGTALAAAGIARESAGSRFTEALELLGGRVTPQLQQPTNFYYPQLPSRPFFEREDFDWAGALEAAAPAIAAEAGTLLEDDSSLAPYVVAEQNRPTKRHPLLADPNWSAFHFFRGGRPITENIARCPATTAALAELPLVTISGRAPMALFSVLRPGTHIPPHWGMTNTRLICHLPLLVPEGCRLRVGNETRAVEAGRIMVFDDTIEHEAWNDGATTRIVLLFEIWRPELDETERRALTVLNEAIGANAPAPEDQAGA